MCALRFFSGFLVLWATVTPLVSQAREIRVFILAGQSNMEGKGIIAADAKRNQGKGTLEHLAKDPATSGRYSGLLDAEGKWRVRDDVRISYLDREGALTVGFGTDEKMIGPELGFGWVVGDAIEDPVLLIKCAWGGKSLAVDFRPPSAGNVPKGLDAGQQKGIAADPESVGRFYREMLSRVRASLADQKAKLKEGDRLVLSGFGWHQGWNDRISEPFNAEYQSNLVHFIRDIRSELAAPDLPFVIAETGMTGPDEAHPRALSLMNAQAAAAEEFGKEGRVAFVKTREFWRDSEISPSNQGYHWNNNAETYYLIGEAMGKAMMDLLGGR